MCGLIVFLGVSCVTCALGSNGLIFWANLHLLTRFLAAFGFLKINNTFCHISVERSLGRIFSLGTWNK